MIDNKIQNETVTFSTGDRVFVKWDDGFLYPGIINNVDENEAEMIWDAEDSTEIMPFDSLKSLILEVGDNIECRWNGEDGYYSAKILSINGEDLELKYIEDGALETTKINMTRLPANYNSVVSTSEGDNENTDIESYEGSSKNEKGFELYNEIIDCWGFAEKDSESGEDLYHPTSYEEVDIAKKKIIEIEELEVDDENLLEMLGTVKEITEEATERKFIGSKWVAIMAGIAVALSLYGALSGFGGNLAGHYSDEDAPKIYNSRIQSIEKSIEYYTLIPDSLKGQRYSKRYQGSEEMRKKSLERFTGELDDLKEIEPMDYLSERNSEIRYKSISRLFSSLLFLALFGSYFYVSRAPIFLINKRKKELALMKAGSGWVKVIITSVLSALWSTPSTTTVTKWSDGSTTSESDAGVLLMLNIFITVLVVAFLFYIMVVALPFLVVINYLRNYQFERLDRYIYMIKRKFGRG